MRNARIKAGVPPAEEQDPLPGCPAPSGTRRRSAQGAAKAGRTAQAVVNAPYARVLRVFSVANTIG